MIRCSMISTIHFYICNFSTTPWNSIDYSINSKHINCGYAFRAWQCASLWEWSLFDDRSIDWLIGTIFISFLDQVRWQSLCDAVKLLGCFTNENRLIDSNNSSTNSKFDYASKHNYELFEQLFYSLDEHSLSSDDLPLSLINACHIARCFHDIALDCIDK